MRNIFILYIPPSNYEALIHYEDTIKNKVEQNRIFKYIDEQLKNKLLNTFGNKKITVWGSRDGVGNRPRYDLMREGDDILIVEGNIIKLLGKVAAKTDNKELSQELWKNIKGNSTDVWNLIYFIANPLEIDLPFNEFNKLFNYKDNYKPQGFTSVAKENLKIFYSEYDDLYSVLFRIKNGETIYKIPKHEKEMLLKDATAVEDNEKEVSEHIQIQYKLAKIGQRIGSKVWLPKNDQTRVQNQYGKIEFEKEFTAALDVPKDYAERIDVVWKDGYRIDAAFEVEHSTEVYSGLLRFSDLKIVTPNSTYPLFIVAPQSRRQKVFNEINRPTFKHLSIDKEVKFLPYELVDEAFESTSTANLFETLRYKSETIST
jgi:hypothetical protein